MRGHPVSAVFVLPNVLCQRVSTFLAVHFFYAPRACCSRLSALRVIYAEGATINIVVLKYQYHAIDHQAKVFAAGQLECKVQGSLRPA